MIDNDIKVTIQNNIFYPLDLEEHLLQLHMVTLNIINITTISTNTTIPSHDKDFFSKSSLDHHTSCHVVLPPSNTTTNNSAIAIDTTSAMDIIHLALHQPTILRKRQLYSRQKLRNRTLKETLKKKIRAKFVYLTNSKSD